MKTINLINWRTSAILIVIVFLFLSGCASNQFKKISSDIPITNIQKIYTPFLEKSFCLKWDGQIYNIHSGTPFSVVMPLCNNCDIIMHTHPIWVWSVPDKMDLLGDFPVWQIYNERYNQIYFGVYKGDLRLYKYNRND